MVQETLNDEIKWLEEKLEAKRLELGSSTEGKAEKELIKEIVKESSAQAPSILTAPPAPKVTSSTNISDEDEEKEHGIIVEDLVADALTNGIAHAMKKADALQNPHLLDDFHDTLADKYYEKLLESRKLKQ